MVKSMKNTTIKFIDDANIEVITWGEVSEIYSKRENKLTLKNKSIEWFMYELMGLPEASLHGMRDVIDSEIDVRRK